MYMERENMELENFKDQIILMSMSNDIEWKKNDENCISNAEKVNHSKRLLPGHWILLCPGSEKRWGTGTPMMDSGTVQPTKWCGNSKKLVILFLTTTSALRRGILKRRNGKSTFCFNGDFMNIALLFQTFISVNQVSVYAVVTIWCCNFCFEEGRKITHSYTHE